MTFLKKQEKRGKSPDPKFRHKAVQDREEEAELHKVLLIDEFLFPHAVFQIHDQDFNVEGLQYAYGKLY